MSLSSLSVEVGVTPLVFGLDHEGREGMSQDMVESLACQDGSGGERIGSRWKVDSSDVIDE